MAHVSFVGVLIVALVAFLAPLLLGLSPARRLPWVVIEIVAGIVIGPSVLGWVRIDLPISILSIIGLAFLLFLAGMEVELERLRSRLLLYVGWNWPRKKYSPKLEISSSVTQWPAQRPQDY